MSLGLWGIPSRNILESSQTFSKRDVYKQKSSPISDHRRKKDGKVTTISRLLAEPEVNPEIGVEIDGFVSLSGVVPGSGFSFRVMPSQKKLSSGISCMLPPLFYWLPSYAPRARVGSSPRGTWQMFHIISEHGSSWWYQILSYADLREWNGLLKAVNKLSRAR